MKISAECPLCGINISFNKMPTIGNQLNCPTCETSLVVVDQSPLELEIIFEELPADPVNLGNNERPIIRCPLCDEKLKLPGKVRIGQIITCTGCESELEIVDTDPIQLESPYDEVYGDEYIDFDDEDFDEDEFDFEDDYEEEF